MLKCFYIDLEPADFWADFEQRIRATNERQNDLGLCQCQKRALEHLTSDAKKHFIILTGTL